MADAPLGALPDGLYGEELDRRISEATGVIAARLSTEPGLERPRAVAVLGSGLGAVVDLLDAQPRLVMPYTDIPHVPGSGVEGHAGQLVAGRVDGMPMVVLSGRSHPYEGHTQRAATLLLRAVLALGPELVILTNAAGGLNPAFDPGDVMLITDHLNLSGENPLLGPNLDRFGPRFPPMTDAYDPRLRARALESAERTRIGLRQGVYVMLSGPSYETRAEMRMLRSLGGDAVGMSTAHEVIVARHAGRRVLGFSLITNKATDDVETGATHEEVIEVGRIGAERLVALLGDLLPRLA
ncbi:MAG TPA: purine-nucleoside phosphorylase [Candidatus Limnocylindria bacterium]|nr:purine-nucleoside phosphorylase [Candidatus Limnocylindria bacterium]